jgi:tripartite-type tricarboxylate transporter receptor subunit TctC
VLVVHPSVPVHKVKDLIALARARPGQLSYGSNGAGSPPHLAGELISTMAKLKLVHVPYKGGGDAAVATAGGQIEMSFPTVPPALSLMDAGKVRALAVTSAKRASILSAIPTLDESGLAGYDISNWNGVSTTAGVPRDIVMKLNTAIASVVNTPEMKETFNRQGIEPQTNTPEQFAAFIRNEIARNTTLIKLSGAKVE